MSDETIYVPYTVPGSSYKQWVSIYTRLNQERIIFLNQTLTDGLANAIVSALLYLDSDDQSKPIYLYINSFGDPAAIGLASPMTGMASIMAGLAIYDTIQHIRSEVITICMGQAIGMATMLLSCGSKGKRASLPHSSIVLNQPRTASRGQASDIQINAQEAIEKKNLVLEILTQTTGQPLEKIAKDTDRMFYMSPQEAKDYGLIDRVLESTKEPSRLAVLT
jgi:ATP-dependent Clp protease protease subunit